jgi:hypothetical protein
VDQQRDGERAPQQGCAHVGQIAPDIQQSLGQGGDDSGAIGTDGGDGDLVHARTVHAMSRRWYVALRV